ncbi:Eco57I restriction-modification methylase domain-containing protein [Caldimonas thermodepolymerans]|uniref:site-specific DNA-methyltransferase (adenine-specific) n=1 Tax=Caldimonas thermodepolymerans TaxID=215580 RepID=A0A2S5T3F6_9BURK|nr:Eco57I restriction-modification methylase domain-containing protein [Caldimonas thermodepolymerans]PPE69486.1 SAM-dependent methyltransferase [Caldimonas thermodepolymerans]QPC31003.1 Eco57I restriction-modification methylase domain-containing protein [Caldimonas thermodepolymerans]RDH96989.1 adenine-specific DNA-methyltransferase [Caldimonas thermodepolymerans]
MSLVEQAHRAGRAFTDGLARDEQKELGQFMTPPAIARFMARRLVQDYEGRVARILEPAAGAGILAAATVEELLARPTKPERVELLLFEYDARLLPALEQLRHGLREACASARVGFDCKIEHGDFLLSHTALSGTPINGLLTIANPPFFKLNKAADERATLHSYAVYGQPNIYALFMAACARLTPPDGRWCFITPRSWMSGTYFKATRQSLLRHLTFDGLHAFESRTEGFEEDSVLQETVIAWARGRSQVEAGTSILFTRSQGVADLDSAEVQAVPATRVVSNDEHAMLSLPHRQEDLFAGWTATLKTYGLEVSTGPVVAFRAKKFIRETAERGTVPLLWLQHVRQQSIRWPVQKKREHILANAESAWMLVRNEPMVVMRRFSPKEDERRVTCAAYGCSPDRLPGDVIGLENHLNYIYRPGGRMTVFEARGLSAFLASKVVDDHFRGLAGSTQVNATELRKLPLPPLAVIEEIGERISMSPTLAEIDAVVNAVLGVGKRAQVAA